MINECFVVGLIRTNCHLVACDRTLEAMVIDPGISTKKELDPILDAIKSRKLELRYIVNTHHHSDHTSGNGALKQATSAEILIHELDAPVLPEPWTWWSRMVAADPDHPCPACGMAGAYVETLKEQGKAVVGCRSCGFKFEVFASPPADRLLRDGDEVQVGMLDFRVIHTPGHSPGGICLYLEDEKLLFSGDTLFSGSIGRTDTIDGSFDTIIESVRKLLELPEDTVVFPGHLEQTTIGQEKRSLAN
ncbi:MAG: MBL fold metallo-hydrolase [candidate division WOR-3 bacterium]|nr:MAG: MBL fold metallo-hydrolase [candidate division WOR-3 bacterium]